LPLAMDANRMARAPGSGSKPPATPRASRMARRGRARVSASMLYVWRAPQPVTVVLRLALVHVVGLVTITVCVFVIVLPGVLVVDVAVGVVVLAVLGFLPRGHRVLLSPQHPEADGDDEDPHREGEVGLHALRDQPRGAHRRQDADKNDPAGVRQRDEDPEHERVDRAAPGTDDVGGRDGLAVPGRRGMECAQPEAGRQVEQSFEHELLSV
jgi:hypothetical protein